MADYIDRENERVRRSEKMEFPKYFYFRVKPNNKGTAIVLEDASDADVVEIVRCKDCCHYMLSPHTTAGIMVCIKYRGVRADDDFCSRGERKE